AKQFPILTEPPLINFNNESGLQLKPSSYPEINPISNMQSSDFSYKPTFSSYPDRRPVRIPSRHHSRPIIHIIESDSCSSISSYSPRHHHHHHHRRSYSHPRQRRFTQQQQQQPIILLPIKCQQSSTMTNSLQGQSQQNLLPTI
ncbi:unnamed protein product, partial [Rotaria sp. Silwood1]